MRLDGYSVDPHAAIEHWDIKPHACYNHSIHRASCHAVQPRSLQGSSPIYASCTENSKQEVYPLGVFLGGYKIKSTQSFPHASSSSII